MLGNGLRVSTTSTGTGSLAFSTVTGLPTLSTQLSASERAAYSILDSNGGFIERGIGYHDGAGNWVREVPMATYVSGVYTGANPTAASLASGTKYILITPGAQTMLTSRQGLWATTNKVYGDLGIVGGVGSITLTADRAYACPAAATVDSDIDAVVFRVTTAGAAGKLAKGAIFSVGSDGLPGVKLAEGSSVAIDSTGVKASTFTRFRPPPVFFICLLSDGAPVLQAHSTGIAPAWGMGADGSLIPNSFIHHVGATSLVFPTTWTPVGNASNAARPGVFVRCP